MNVSVLKTKSEELPVRTGIDRKDREKLAELMGRALASTYVLYHKTHAYHWNISGPLFYSVHKMTDEQYQDMAEAIDNIAERIRAIGFSTPTGLKRYLSESVVDDATETPEAGGMIAELASDHQKIATQLREAVKAADEADDVYTADLLTARIGAHEEAAWMLNAIIVKS